jgi:hypothetical protein
MKLAHAIPIAMLILLCGCVGPMNSRTGAPVKHRWPQAAEQCAAQPELPWC